LTGEKVKFSNAELDDLSQKQIIQLVKHAPNFESLLHFFIMIPNLQLQSLILKHMANFANFSDNIFGMYKNLSDLNKKYLLLQMKTELDDKNFSKFFYEVLDFELDKKSFNKDVVSFSISIIDLQTLNIDKFEKKGLIKFLKLLYEMNSDRFWDFCSKYNLNIEVVLTIVESQAVYEYFLQNYKDIELEWTSFNNFGQQLLKDKIMKAMSFKELFENVNNIEFVSSVVSERNLKSTIQRCLKADEKYSVLFENVDSFHLKNALAALEMSMSQKIQDNNDLKYSYDLIQNELLKAKSLVQSFVDEKRSNIQSQINSKDNSDKIIKIGFFIDLLESLEKERDVDKNFSFESVIKRLGVEQIGQVGHDFLWNIDMCESITGFEFEIGTVVKSGYRITLDKETLILRRVLLKPRSEIN
jgi:hypothetical protein